jgi:hypothetical protein
VAAFFKSPFRKGGFRGIFEVQRERIPLSPFDQRGNDLINLPDGKDVELFKIRSALFPSKLEYSLGGFSRLPYLSLTIHRQAWPLSSSPPFVKGDLGGFPGATGTNPPVPL